MEGGIFMDRKRICGKTNLEGQIFGVNFFTGGSTPDTSPPRGHAHAINILKCNFSCSRQQKVDSQTTMAATISKY